MKHYMEAQKTKKLAKIISITMLIAMTLALCACGSTAATTAADSSAPAADTAAPAADSAPASPSNALEQIKADGVLSVALSPDFAPMEFVDSSKSGQEQYVGFDVTLAKYIADYIGVELNVEPMSFNACQTAVYTASVPMSISGYSWTEERAENYELSDYYYAGDNETEQVILIHGDRHQNSNIFVLSAPVAAQVDAVHIDVWIPSAL